MKKFTYLTILFSFSMILATESIENEKYQENYKSNTINEKIEQMESLELRKATPFRKPNVKAFKKG